MENKAKKKKHKNPVWLKDYRKRPKAKIKPKNRHIKLTGLPKTFKPGFLGTLDERTRVYAELKNALTEITNDLGGRENLSYIQITLAERFIFVTFMLRLIEQQIVMNPNKSGKLLGRWAKVAGSLNVIARILGLKRMPKRVKDLATHLKLKKG